jgi:hypothetical protein
MHAHDEARGLRGGESSEEVIGSIGASSFLDHAHVCLAGKMSLLRAVGDRFSFLARFGLDLLISIPASRFFQSSTEKFY